MAREITITDNLSSIQLTITNTIPTAMSATTNIAKANIVNIDLATSDIVCLTQYEERPRVMIDWNDVISPAVVSGTDLYAQLLAIWLNAPAAGIFTQTATFANAELVAGVYTITHTFATTNVFVTVQDPTGVIIYPNVTVVDNANVTLDFGGAIGAGNYSYTLIAII